MAFTLDELNQQAARNSVEFLNYPTIKIDQDEDSEGVGKVYIERRTKKDDKWVKERTYIESPVPVTLLHFRFKFEYYEKDVGMIAQTNEFDDWNETVYVHDVKGRILMCGHYKDEVKPWMMENFPKGQGKHMFAMKRILYVEYKGEIYRLVLSPSTYSGTGGFDAPVDPMSYKGYTSKLYKKAKEHMLNYSTSMTPVFKKTKIAGKVNSFYIFEFDLLGKHAPGEVPLEVYNNLHSSLAADEKRRFHDKVGKTSFISKQPILQDNAVEVQLEEVEAVFTPDKTISADEFHDKPATKPAKSPWDNINDDL